MAIRTRKNVHTLPAGDSTLLWYARAVDAMRKRPTTDPTSWNYQAAMHGFASTLPAWQGVGTLPSSNERIEYWNQCQHGSWYFLPWHRMYLAYFEEIVMKAINDLGGPGDWALPFWDYSDKNARSLPAAFSASSLPGLTNGNPLNLPGRVLGTQGHQSVPSHDVALSALKHPNFVADVHGGNPGFGGPRTGFSHGGGAHGLLETRPHDLVHMDVGGVMSDPRTAALDPIFWLHHANIDRLWQLWLDTEPGSANPVDAQWLNRTFDFRSSASAPVAISASQVLDTTKVLSGYIYEGLEPTAAPIGKRDAAAGTRLELSMKTSIPPEVMAATNEAQPLKSTAHSLTLNILQVNRAVRSHLKPLASIGDISSPTAEAFLNFENIVGTGVAPIYDVYLNLPNTADKDADRTDFFAGSLPMFGVAASSIPDVHQSGSGTHYVLHITELLNKLRARPDWNEGELRVTLVPRGDLPQDASVTIGRVSLYLKQAAG
jgi:tyrosinase